MDAIKKYKYDVTIITINYNVTEKLYKCVESVLQYCENVNYVWFLIDNASEDADFNEVIEKYSKYNQFKFIRNETNEGGATLNKVFDKIDSRYILHLHPDVIIKDNVIRKLIDFMDSRPDAGGATAKLLNLDGTPQGYYGIPWNISTVFYMQTKFGRLIDRYFFSNKRKKFLKKKVNLNPKTLMTTDQVGTVCLIRRSKLILEDGYISDPLGKYFYGDVDMCKRITNKGYKLYVVPWVEVYHHRGASFEKKKRLWIEMEKQKAQIKFFRKFYKRKVWILKLILLPNFLVLMIENKLYRRSNKRLFWKFRKVIWW